MKPITKTILSALLGTSAIMALPTAVQADGYSNTRVVVYFTRHAEKQTVLNLTSAEGVKPKTYVEFCGDEKCAEELNAEGELRAQLLAEWFSNKGITSELTHAFSSHKTRTRQTIELISQQAMISGHIVDDTDADICMTPGTELCDKNPGDGIQEFPVYQSDDSVDFATELAPQGTGGSEDPTVNALLNLPDGSVALVAGHSGTLYDIMAKLGLEDACTSARIDDNVNCNADRYPFNDDNKVANFGDVWKITLRNGVPRFNYRVNLQVKKLAREGKVVR